MIEKPCQTCRKTMLVYPFRASGPRERKFCSWPCYRQSLLADESKAFWGKVEKTDSCWLYRGALNKDGYGTLNRRGRMLSAHRMAWTLTHGAPKDGLWVLHRCDVRNCVNPAHLFLGTRQDNVADACAKERHIHGERHIHAKLTAAAVRAIRRSNEDADALAALYGTTRGTINNVKAYRTWKLVR